MDAKADRVVECAECGRVLVRVRDGLSRNERDAVVSLLERSIARVQTLLTQDFPDQPSDLNGTWGTVLALYDSALLKIQRGGRQ
jgi:hypothetical protein